MKTLREKLRDRGELLGIHMCLTEPCISEMCARSGYDFLWIDIEHAAIDYRVLLYYLMGVKANGTDTLVRIPQNNQVLTERVLEMGPTGIIIPMTNTVQELDTAIQTTLYPPCGIREFSPLRAVRYGLDNTDSFIEPFKQQPARYVQTETKTAVKNLKKVAKNPYVGCSTLGPYGLPDPIGELNRVSEDHISSLAGEAVAIINENGESFDVSTDSDGLEIVRYWYEKGANVISASSDYVHIMDGARKELNIPRQIRAKQGGQTL